jgi:hypothetical protein
MTQDPAGKNSNYKYGSNTSNLKEVGSIMSSDQEPVNKIPIPQESIEQPVEAPAPKKKKLGGLGLTNE